MSYRDDFDAAVRRADALQADLNAARQDHAGDAGRIANLERELLIARQTINNLNQGQYQYPPQYYPQAQLPSSNATMVLVFGILSLVVCGLFGPFAWYYGNVEIQRMDSGLVSPHGRGSAVAGKICGIISSCLLMFAAFFIFLTFSVFSWR